MPASSNLKETVLYYWHSLFSLQRNVNNWTRIPQVFFRQPLTLELPDDLKLRANGPMQVWTIKEVCLDEFYNAYFEPEKGWTIIDIGAGLGDFAIYNAGRVKKVIGYDKNTLTDGLFKENIKLNKVKNVIFKNKLAKSLDEILKENKLIKCDLIKLDCEGAEYALLNPASIATLKKFTRIVMEYHLFNDEQKRQFKVLVKKLKDAGYKITEDQNPVHSNLGFLFATLAK
jgi:precorrin-6B methylase 2